MSKEVGTRILNSNASYSKNINFITLLENLIQTYKETYQSEILLPISIFYNNELGILEAIVKYLRENQNLSFQEISLILNRDNRTIWTSYYKAQQKDINLKIEPKCSCAPVKIFANRSVSPLEAIIQFLKSKLKWTFKDIALTLNRSYNTVWSTYKKTQKKSNRYE